MTPAKSRATVPTMGKVKIRYFVSKPGAAGPRYFWQPAKALRVHGWQMQRLPDDRRLAIDKANALNDELDAWRAGGTPISPTAPAPLPLVQPHTLAAIIRIYKASRRYTSKAAKTKRSYDQNIAFLEKWGGEMKVAAITPDTVETLYVSMKARTPAKAAAVITMLRILLGAALRQDPPWVIRNAAAAAGIEGAKPSGRIWPREALRLLVEAADAAGWHSLGTFVTINHWLGQREGDVLAMQLGQISNGRINFEQSKTGARVSIPETSAVATRIAAELARQEARSQALRDQGATPLPRSTFLVCETTGRPWTEHYFRHVFADVRTALAIAHPTIAHADGTTEITGKLLLMHLRHTAVTELAVAGCTPLQIRGITGHSINTINTILERYLVLTAALADEAAALRTAYDARQTKQGGNDVG